MDNRFCCFGTYSESCFKCLVKCQDKEDCERETKIRKWIKYEKPKEEYQNGKNL